MRHPIIQIYVSYDHRDLHANHLRHINLQIDKTIFRRRVIYRARFYFASFVMGQVIVGYCNAMVLQAVRWGRIRAALLFSSAISHCDVVLVILLSTNRFRFNVLVSHRVFCIRPGFVTCFRHVSIDFLMNVVTMSSNYSNSILSLEDGVHQGRYSHIQYFHRIFCNGATSEFRGTFFLRAKQDKRDAIQDHQTTNHEDKHPTTYRPCTSNRDHDGRPCFVVRSRAGPFFLYVQ